MDNYIIVKPLRKNKKYSVLKYDKDENKYKYHLSFGQLGYEHYKDSTPLKLWSNLDHNDKDRRELYYKRHKKTNNKNLARYWSNNFLW